MPESVTNGEHGPPPGREPLDRQRRMAAVGGLTRVFAHDLNNILGSLLGSAHLLAMKNRDPALKEKLDTIAASAARAISLTQAFAALAEHGLSSADIDAHDLLHRLAAARAAPAPLIIAAAAGHAKIRGDSAILSDSIAILANVIACSPGFTGSVRITTANRGQVASGGEEVPGASWLRIALDGQGGPLSAAQRRIIEAPLSVTADDTPGILLAGAVTGIGRSHGLVRVPEGDGAALWIDLPTVGAAPGA